MNSNYSMIALLGYLLASADPAAAELTMVPVNDFTEAEREVVARNASLRVIVDNDPATVRAFLDGLKAAEEAERAAGSPDSSDRSAEDDRDANPDIKRLERASPEAAHDLLQLIKKAGTTGKN